MDGESNREVELFSEALDVPPEEREAFLTRACAGDEALRRRVEQLLATHQHVGGFLEDPPAQLPGNEALPAGLGEKLGDWIGHYKLVQQIGEGGCGVVYMAEQHEPVRRSVALKIIKPGMDTKSVIARFEAERQALALMDHPNIAKVFDAGATASGRPYFVMELVRGVKITEYCDQHYLATCERLQLFIQVCQAVQHAHQKGIIHRDIKPSNILVTASEDGKPVPKVIDFGIAKSITGLRLTDKTLFTAFEMLVGTPAYMSPEQAALTSVDVDTRSDIYSLGVLLYELLTGTTPFDTGNLFKAGLDEIRRVIQSRDPARPSTRLSAMLAADLTNISRRRQAEPYRLIRDLRGDLDWIVMKALEKDRARRYPSANDLAKDLEHSMSGEVIAAHPPSALYKTRVLMARNKLLFGGLAVLFLFIMVSLVSLGKLLLVEKAAREKADHYVQAFKLENLGIGMTIQSNYPEAQKAFLEAFKLRHQYLEDDPPSSVIFALYIQAIFLADGPHDIQEIKLYLPGFLKGWSAMAMSATARAYVHEALADYLAQEGRWQEAVPYMAAVIPDDAQDADAYQRLIAILVAQKDLPAYRHICADLIGRFGKSSDVKDADRTAKDCLILPSSGVNLEAAAALAEVAVTKGTNLSVYPFFELSKALAEYRQDHFAEATNWAAQAAAS